jgi:hypothetical protein
MNEPNRHWLRIEILPFPFPCACYRGAAREESEKGYGQEEKRSKEGETFRRGVSLLSVPLVNKKTLTMTDAAINKFLASTE